MNTLTPDIYELQWRKSLVSFQSPTTCMLFLLLGLNVSVCVSSDGLETCLGCISCLHSRWQDGWIGEEVANEDVSLQFI